MTLLVVDDHVMEKRRFRVRCGECDFEDHAPTREGARAKGRAHDVHGYTSTYVVEVSA